MIKEIADIMDEHEAEINHSLIDKAFQEIIEYRNNNYFEHYHSRLKSFFSGNNFEFITALLHYIVTNDTIKKGDLYNLATRFDVVKDYKGFIKTLVYDGYIHLNDDEESYRFNSPILKLWWKEHVN